MTSETWALITKILVGIAIVLVIAIVSLQSSMKISDMRWKRARRARLIQSKEDKVKKLNWKFWAILAVIFTVGIGIAIAVAVWPENKETTKSLTQEQIHAISIYEYGQFLLHHKGEDQIVDVLLYYNLDITPYCEWIFYPYPIVSNTQGGSDRWFIECQIEGKHWETVTDFTHKQNYDDGEGLNNPDTQRLIEFLIREGFVKVDADSKVQHFSEGFQEINRGFVRCIDDCIVLQSRFDDCFVQQILAEEDVESYLIYVPNKDSYVGDSIDAQQCGNDKLIVNTWMWGDQQLDLVEKAQ